MPRQMTLDLGLRQAPGLLDFIAGLHDEHARLLSWVHGWLAAPPHAVTQAWGDALGAYLHGATGAGKSHLLQGVLGEAVARGWGGISLSATTCQMWDPIDPAWPTLAVVDDADRLPPDHQHLAFNLYLQAAASRVGQTDTRLTDVGQTDPADAGQGALFILAAGAVPPALLDARDVRDDLRTRLAWGLSFALQPLDDDGVRQALQREAARRGLPLPDELVNHLLTRFSRNLGRLMALLDQLDDYALAAHRSPTVPLLKQMLALETP